MVALGVIGLVSMVVFRVALRAYDYDYLPAALAGRVRWWARHHVAVLALSGCLLLAGLVVE